MYIVIGTGIQAFINNIMGESQPDLMPSTSPVVHKTFEIAQKEAARLSVLHNKQFYVFSAVGVMSPPEIPKPKWESML